MKRILRPSDIRPDRKREVGDELRFHLEMRTREFVEQGMSPEEGRRAAQASFGDVAAITAELEVARADRDRERARRDWWRGTSLDLRHAGRALRTHPLFAGATILMLALGIGATVAIFTVVNGVLLRPLPYADPASLAMIWTHGDGASAAERWPVSSGMYLDLSARLRTTAASAAFRAWPQTLREADMAEQFAGARVTPSLFPLLGARAALGRVFEARDTVAGAEPVALISDGLWRRRYGGAPSVLGRRVTLGGVLTTIIGVMPPGFTFPRGAELPSGLQFPRRTDLWTPLGFTEADARNYGTQNLAMIARLRPGTSAASMQQDVDRGIRDILTGLGATRFRLGGNVVPLQEQASAPVRRILLIVLAGVTLVLVIACVNVTNLLIARTAERGRELAVRIALGARRQRVARQLVTENLVLALAGGAVGALLAVWGVRALLALVPGTLPRADDVQVDWRVLIVAIGLSAACGIIFGLVSALTFSRTNVLATLQGTGVRTSRGPRARLGRRALVTLQVALSLVLLITAGLLAGSFVRLYRVDSGFDPRGAMTADVSLPIGGRFDPARDGPGWARFFETLMGRLTQVPGVDAAGAISALPLSGTIEGSTFLIEGEPPPQPNERPRTGYAVVAGDYFRAAGITLLRGRLFDERDRSDAPGVVLISESLARRYFANQDPIGQRVLPGFFFVPGPREIVGVVDDVKMQSLADADAPVMYAPESQMTYPGLSVVVRSRLPADAVVAAMRRELKAVDPTVALDAVRPLQEVFDESLARQRFSLVLIAIFAATALTLSVAGLYGIVALGVQQRRRELGVRMALGARPRDVQRLVLREGVAMTAIGVAVGVGLAFATTRVLRALLFDMSATNAAVFAASATIVAAVALGASYLPALRATAIEPSRSLRE
jgi:putative ABC transport system permease protein